MALTNIQIERLKEIYATTLTADIAEDFSVSIYVIRNAAYSLKLKKDAEWVRERSRINMMREDHPGRKYWIKKGNTPANKGMKQADYMSAEAIERTVKTRFKKGNRPQNHKQVGYERTTRDGYIEVKVAEPNIFKLKHRVVWEKHNGKIPTGHNVQFKDGNRLNVDIENLYIINRSDQMKNENSMYARYPKDVQLAIHAKGVLNREINKLTKKENI